MKTSSKSKNFNYIVYHNPGQYVSMQEEYFLHKTDAEKFVKEFLKKYPRGQVRMFSSHDEMKTEKYM